MDCGPTLVFCQGKGARDDRERSTKEKLKRRIASAGPVLLTVAVVVL